MISDVILILIELLMDGVMVSGCRDVMVTEVSWRHGVYFYLLLLFVFFIFFVDLRDSGKNRRSVGLKKNVDLGFRKNHRSVGLRKKSSIWDSEKNRRSGIQISVISCAQIFRLFY